MRAAIYCRCSTDEQTVGPQLFALRRYVAARGLVVAGEYLDEGESGAKPQPPALGRLMQHAHRHAFDVVVVACLLATTRASRRRSASQEPRAGD